VIVNPHLVLGRRAHHKLPSGRFLSEDPAISPVDDPGAAHPYLYGGADPVDQKDPNGQDFGSVLQLSAIAVTAASFIPVVLTCSPISPPRQDTI
jgi:hypothetical protein